MATVIQRNRDAAGILGAVNVWDYSNYADGVHDDTLALADADLDAQARGAALIINRPYRMASRLTLLSPTFWLPGGLLQPDSGRTATLNGQLLRPAPRQLFGGKGSIVLGAGATHEGYGEWWGAKRDGVVLSDVSMTNGSPLATSVAGTFSAADVGKSVIVYDPVAMAVVASSYPSVTSALTVASVNPNNPHQCTLSGNAVATGTGLTMVYGSDDTAPVAAAITALSAIQAWLQGLAGIYVGGTGTTIQVNGSNQGCIWRPVTNTRIRGLGKGQTTYASTVYHQQVFMPYQANDIEYRDLTIRSDGAGADGLKNLGCNGVEVHRVSGVNNCYSVKFVGCQNVKFSDIETSGDYVDPITSAGGYGMQIDDLAALLLTGTKNVQGRGLKSTGAKYGTLAMQGDTSITSKPEGIDIAGIEGDTCGYGQTALPNVLMDWVDSPVLNGVRALKCGVGVQSQHGPNRVKITGAVAEQCYGEGFIAYGDSYGQYDTIDAFDCNQGNIGLIAGILFEDDGSAVGSTNNVVTNARSGVRTWRQVTDGVTTNGLPTISSASANFTAADVNMVIVAGSLVTTIASVQSATNATMTANANATATGVTLQIGTAPAHQGYQCQSTNSGHNTVTGSDFTSACSSKGTVNAKSGTLTDYLANNVGDTTAGSYGAIAVGASPWTYTAGPHKETLYVSGGTVSSITIGGVQAATATNVAITPQPGQSMVITYSVVPTVLKIAHN